MAFVPVEPIGSESGKFLDDGKKERNAAFIQEKVTELESRREEVKSGWGADYIKRVHEKGKWTAWERLDALRDPDAPVHTLGTFANWGIEFGQEERSLKSPGAGVVCAITRVQERWVVVIANDNTVASGSWWPGTPEKIERAQQIGLSLKIPVIYLVDCSGLFLPEQARSFPGKTGAGHIFKKNSELSDAGVPQIAGVFGDCIAGGGYMPIISDRVYMTEQAYMVIAGAALIQGAKSQELTSLDIGGPDVHVDKSGCADARVPDDKACIEAIREEISKTASSGAPFRRGSEESAEPAFPPKDLDFLFPPDHRMAYDTRQVLARLVDRSLFWEILPNRGKEIVCGVGRVGGLWAGFVGNVQGTVPHPKKSGALRPGGILYKEGIAKMSAFARACNDDGIPLIWLQDIGGFDIGTEAEAEGLLGYGSSLIYANSTQSSPMFTVLLRKASGAGYYAMAGLPYDPIVQLATPFSRLAVMEGRTLATAAWSTRLNDEFEPMSEDPEEIKRIKEGMKEVEERIEADMDPYAGASQQDIDEIISPSELHGWLQCLVEAAWQGQGGRRMKNPRIWSLHDLSLLGTPQS